MMRSVAYAAVLSVAALPGLAEDSKTEEGFSLLEEGTRLLLRGLLEDMEPAMRDFAEGLNELEPQLRGFVESLGPALRDWSDVIGDLNQYHAPERLPNGDIVLRRKVPVLEPPTTDEAPQIDL